MYYSNLEYNDGFGSQYMRIIKIYIFCKLQNLNFVYRPLSTVEHNYSNDVNFIEKLESFINLKNNIPNINNYDNVKSVDYYSIAQYCESNIDAMFESDHLKFIKKCFWENKDKNVFKNNKTNVAVHIRRENIIDKGLAGSRVSTPNSYYLNIMNVIREKYKNKNLLFHIYSQGDIENFKMLQEKDVEFHLDEDLCKTFLEFVAADILVISPSTFSFCAALLSDGEIYYKRFGHNPKKEWIECG